MVSPKLFRQKVNKYDDLYTSLEKLTFMLIAHVKCAVLMRRSVILLGRLCHAVNHRIIGMSLHVFLEILGTFKGLATKLTSVRLQGYVNSDVRSDMVAFHDLNMTVPPCALQVEVIGTLSTNMLITDMVLKQHQ